MTEGYKEAKRILTFKIIQRETRELLYGDDINKKLQAFGIIFQELFTVFWGQKWDLEAAKEWKRFCDELELTAKDYLNRNIKQMIKKRSVEYSDVYFSVIKMDGYSLLEDALLARKLGHHLTENHMDILLRTKAVTSREELEKHNAEWFERHRIEEQDDKFFEEEMQRDNLLEQKGIVPLVRDKWIRWDRDRINLFASSRLLHRRPMNLKTFKEI